MEPKGRPSTACLFIVRLALPDDSALTSLCLTILNSGAFSGRLVYNRTNLLPKGTIHEKFSNGGKDGMAWTRMFLR
jgi:hypothetical protein